VLSPLQPFGVDASISPQEEARRARQRAKTLIECGREGLGVSIISRMNRGMSVAGR